MRNKQKIEFLDQVPKISDSEIDSFKNFDSIFEKYTDEVSRINDRKLNGKIIGSSSILLLSLLATFYFYWSPPSEEGRIAKVEPNQSTEQIAAPVIKSLVKKKQKSENKELVENKLPDPEPKEKTIGVKKPIIVQTQKSSPSEYKTQESQPNTDDPQVSTEKVVESPAEMKTPIYIHAEPIDGYDTLYAHFQKSIIYPDEYRKDSIVGTTLVSFAILKDSSIANIRIEETLGSGFDIETIRVIENMPKWKPATVNGNPVSSRFVLPLKFELKTNHKIETQIIEK